MKTSALIGTLTGIPAAAPDQNAPRNWGFSFSVTQFAPAAAVLAGVQLPRLSSARANNSANFGSFPAVNRVRRFKIQPTAARRAGSVSPWQDQPPYGLRMPAHAYQCH